MDWNRANPVRPLRSRWVRLQAHTHAHGPAQNVLAVGYGRLDFGGDAPGLVMVWAVKNPLAPQRVIHTRRGCVRA